MRFGKTSLISLILPVFKKKTLANRLRGLAQQSKASSLLCRRRGRAPRVNLRRRSQRCSPLTFLLQRWQPFLQTTGAGHGQLEGR
jgi:hypothetical protein